MWCGITAVVPGPIYTQKLQLDFVVQTGYGGIGTEQRWCWIDSYYGYTGLARSTAQAAVDAAKERWPKFRLTGQSRKRLAAQTASPTP